MLFLPLNAFVLFTIGIGVVVNYSVFSMGSHLDNS